jgi:hypothetical protein
MILKLRISFWDGLALYIDFSFLFHDLAFSASLHCAVGADSPQKNKTKKAPETASGSTAVDYHPYTRSLVKNDKLPTVKQCRFLNAHLSLQSALQMPRIRAKR